MMELDAPDKSRLSQSAGIAAGIWVVVLVILALIPLSRDLPDDREFPEVRITLDRTVLEPVESRSSEPAVTTSSQPSTTAATVTPRETTRQTPARQTAAASREPARTEASQAQSSSGLGIPDFQSSSGTPAAPSGETLDFSSERPREQTVRTPGTVQNEFEGSAARVTQTPSRPGTASTEGGSRVSAASDDTLQALDQIRAGNTGGVSVPDATPSASAPTTARTGSRSSETVGPISFEGSSRRLIHPSEPVIVLPPHLARLIDSDRAVTVHFLVRADGSVPASHIRFMPSALLPAEVQNYLRNEFMNWRFERGNDDGQARFVYSIKVQ